MAICRQVLCFTILVIFLGGCSLLNINKKTESSKVAWRGLSEFPKVKEVQIYLSEYPDNFFANYSSGYSRVHEDLDRQITSAYGECVQGNWQNGVNQLKEKLKGADNKTPFWVYLGHCYFLKKDFAQTRFFYDLALGQKSISNDNKKNIYNNLAVMFLRQKFFAQAEFLLKKALSLDPHFSPSQFNMAMMFMIIGQVERGRITLQKMSDSSKNPFYKKILAYSYLLEGDLKRMSQVLSDSNEKDLEIVLLQSIADYNNGVNARKVYDKVSRIRIVQPLFSTLLVDFKETLKRVLESHAKEKV